MKSSASHSRTKRAAPAPYASGLEVFEMGEYDYDVKKGLLAAGIAFVFGVLWFIGNMVIPTIVPSLNIIAVLLSAVVIFIVPFYASGIALRADNRHKAPGGHMRGIGDVGLIVAVLLLGAAMITAAVLMQPKAAPTPQSITPSTCPSGTTWSTASNSCVVPSSPLSSETYQVRGLAAAPTVSKVSFASITNVAQTFGVDAVDADQGTAVTSLTVVNLTDSVSGIPYQKSVLPGGSVLTALVTKSGYISDVVTMRSGAFDTNPTAHAQLKAYDSAVTFAIYNSGGHTANAVTSAATRQALGVGVGTKTVSVEMSPSAKNKRIAGGDTGQFAVLINATNTTSAFIAGNFAVKTNGGFAAGTVAGTPLSLTQNPTGLGGNYITGFSVPADFTGTDQGTYKLDLTIGTSSAWTDANSTMSVCIVPIEYYQQVTAQTGIAKGAIRIGAVKDDGSAINAAQCEEFFLGTGAA